LCWRGSSRAPRTSPDRWRGCFALLDSALDRWPDDRAALLERLPALGALRDGPGAVESARAAVACAPQSEVALLQLASAARAADDHATALGTATALIGLNPTPVDHRLVLANARLARGDWLGVEEDARAALALEPTRGNARFLLAVALNKRGDATSAKREFELVQKVTADAATRAQLARWFADLTK
jgi:tetratricopeptide (TPR) repeat protein